MYLLLAILLFYLLPIVIIKYFNRWTSPSMRLISNNPDGIDLIFSFCPVANIVIAVLSFTFCIMEKVVIVVESAQGGKVRDFLIKIIT